MNWPVASPALAAQFYLIILAAQREIWVREHQLPFLLPRLQPTYAEITLEISSAYPDSSLIQHDSL